MIALLTGTLVAKETSHCIVDVNGVGYSVHISLGTFASLPEVGNDIKLTIHTHVREDQLVLFGFLNEGERTIFQRLITISGVGPKTALAILSGLPAGDLIEAIGQEDSARLTSIPGVGKKTAERIIVELKDRIAKDVHLKTFATSTPRGRLYEDAVSALVNLGYQRAVAESALKRSGWTDGASIEDAIRSSLKLLCRV